MNKIQASQSQIHVTDKTNNRVSLLPTQASKLFSKNYFFILFAQSMSKVVRKVWYFWLYFSVTEKKEYLP